MDKSRTCKLALADGTIFTGKAFGATGSTGGEVVFNTSMTGYQEVLTDPSYSGQIVTMTYPQIGNVGVNEEDIESFDARVQVAGFVIRTLSPRMSNFRSTSRIEDYLARAGIMGIAEIDTRALTRHIRTAGAMNGLLSTEVLDDVDLLAKARELPSMAGANWVQHVTPAESYFWDAGFGTAFDPPSRLKDGEKQFSVVAIDCGVKTNILRNLVMAGCDVEVVPANTPAKAILEREPAGVFVSNGPGDPAAVTGTIETLTGLLGQVPIFGICLGHQMLSLALGGRTYKLKFGHRGANHPVRNEATGKVEITSQNHGFAVDADSLAAAGGIVTHINLNDMTVEGFTCPDKAVFSVQYHPEASPGPHDATYLFDCFRDMMDTGAAPTAEQMHAAQQRLAEASATGKPSGPLFAES